MKCIKYILLILSVLFTLSHNVGAGTTGQIHDVIIIDKVEHELNAMLLHGMDSATYDALKKELDFNSSSFSLNWKGYVSTFEVTGGKLYLRSIKTSSVHTDFKGLLDKYMDQRGRVFASWVSGKFICGYGERIYNSHDGWDHIYEQETELVIEAGVVVSCRSYTNKTRNVPGTVSLDDIKQQLSKEFDFEKFSDLKGLVVVQISASEFNDAGKIMDWSMKVLSRREDLSQEQKEQIFTEVRRVLNRYDWKTCMRDGIWYWNSDRNIHLNLPLFFR